MRSHERTAEMSAVWHAVGAFARGRPVLIHDADDREDETDLVSPASAVVPDDVARLRTDAGGLICVTLSAPVAEAFDLPFLVDVVGHPIVGDEDGARRYANAESIPFVDGGDLIQVFT
jgi:3,4-dihydroxy 2-butanone 4-phosphate synthase